MGTSVPWDIEKALQPSRLMLLARLAAEARQSAIDDARRDEGDTNWGIGCRAYERFAFKLSRASIGSARGWLRVLRDGLSISMSIDGVVMRAYTGAADRPELRHVIAAQMNSTQTDDRQLSLPFAVDARDLEDPRWVWLMAVETDTSGAASRVVFFQAHPEGMTRNAWRTDVRDLPRRHGPRRPASRRAPIARRRSLEETRSLFP